MIIAIPSVGVVLLVLFAAYLFLAAPTGSTKSLLITIMNLILFAVILYLILGFFQVI